MKVKRHKRIRKHTQFYKQTYGIKPPYKILMDGQFIQAALEGKVRIDEQVPKTLQEKSTMYVTKCVMHKLKEGGPFYRGAVMIGSKYPNLQCRHEDVIAPNECIKLLVAGGNPDQLILAAQDLPLRTIVRKQAGTPLMFIRGQVPVLEPPTEKTQKKVAEKIKEQSSITKTEKRMIAESKDEEGGESKPKRKRKGPKQPNPLSCKKKKKTSTPQPKKEKAKAEVSSDAVPAAAPPEASREAGEVKPKRKRVRNRVRVRKRPEGTSQSQETATASDGTGVASSAL